jgi:tetratricopeptide (TPR) repeat protein/CHAT domain-containing protein
VRATLLCRAVIVGMFCVTINTAACPQTSQSLSDADLRKAVADGQATYDAGDRLGEATALDNTGNGDVELGRYDEALRAYQGVLAICRELKDRFCEAGALGNIGGVDYYLGRYDDALRTEQEALAIDREIENHLGEANAVTTIGAIDVDLGRYDDALRAEQDALAIHRELKNRIGEADDLTNVGIVDEDLGRYDDALRAEQDALAIHRDIKNRIGEAGALGNIGNVELELGRYDESLLAHQEALAIHRELKNRLDEASDLNNIGDVDEDLGRYDDALRAYQDALAIHREFKNRLGEATDLNNIGIVDEDLGQYDDALRAEQDALAINRELKNRLGEANDVGSIGNVDEDLGRYDDALRAHQDALAIDRELKYRIGEADDLTNVGIVDVEVDRYDDALRAEQDALAIHRELKNRLGEADDLGNIGVIDYDLGRYDDALNAAKDGVNLSKAIGEATVWQSLFALAAAEAKLGGAHEQDATTQYDDAISHIEQLRTGLEQKGERESFFGRALFVYDEYVAYLRDLDRRYPGRGYDRKALEILERKNARVILEEVGKSVAHRFAGVPDSVVASEDDLETRLGGARATLSKLLAASTSDFAAVTAARQQVDDLQVQQTRLLASIKTQYPAYYAVRHPEPIGVTDLQTRVLAHGEVILAYDELAEADVLFVISRDQPLKLVSLAGQAEVDKDIKRLLAHFQIIQGDITERDLVSRIDDDAAHDLPGFAADSYALYQQLVPTAILPIIAHAKHLIIVPSGTLYDVPWEALVTQQPNGGTPHYLIEDEAISYVPSASLLGVLRSTVRKGSAPNPLLAIARPTYEANTQGAAATPSASGMGTRGLTIRSVRGDHFDDLPGTEQEADEVRDALHASVDSVIERDDATHARILELNGRQSGQGALRDYRYVLFATHAVLGGQIPGITGPALALAHADALTPDGFLTMADVFGLTLHADFVTLSACSTGSGPRSIGDGISGLTRAFFYAGTPAVSVTLWPVLDEAAPQITPAFFAAMHGGMAPADALRQTKMHMIDAPEARFRHPFSWAPSVIFGDGGGTR